MDGSLIRLLLYLLDRAATNHVCLDLCGNFFILRIQILHCLVLRLFCTLLDCLNLLRILGIAPRDRIDLVCLLLVYTSHRGNNVTGRHKVIDCLAVL